MCEPAAIDYQAILTENYFLFSKYLVAEDFFEMLISSNVLSVNDKELIKNPYTNPSRRERANKLIEILLTRGHEGYLKFIEILEYLYPHVYKEVTKKEPRPPPHGTVRNRVSDRLRMINDLPNLAQHIKDQFEKNTELGTQLQVLQNILEFSKEENAALEKEIETLKNVRQDSEQLKLRLKQLENEKIMQQAEANKDMQRTFQYIAERDEYRDKCQNLQVDYDELNKKHKEIQNKLSARGQLTRSATNPLSNDSTDLQMVELPPKPSTSQTNHDQRAQHMVARTGILQDDLINSQIRCDDLASKLQRSEEALMRLEQDIEMINKELNKTLRENKVTEKQLKVANSKTEVYMETIRKKDMDMMELQSQKLEDQHKYNELLREKNDLTQRNHKLGQELQKLQFEIDRINARHSGSSQDYSSSFNSGSDEDTGGLEDADYIDFNDQCVSLKKRRNIVKKQSNRSWDDSLTELEKCKASTLPAPVNDSSEMVFQREVARYRYTRKREFLKKQSSTSSMNAQDGSMLIRNPKAEGLIEDPMAASQNFNYSFLYDGSTKREAVTNPADSEDNVSASQSSVYIPRTSDNGHFAISISQKGPLPSGGKHYVRRDKAVIGDGCGVDVPDSVSDNVFSNNSTDPSDTSSESSRVADFSSYDVCTHLLPRDCLTVTHPGLPENCTIQTVSLKSPISDKIEIKGGNHTGIYIGKVLKNLELKEGDEVKEIIYTPNEKAEPVVVQLKGCLLDDAYKLLSEEYIRKKKEKEVKIKIRTCQSEYQSMCQLMEKNDGTGDFMFIRCNVAMENRTEQTDEISLNPSQVFLVTNTRHGRRQWSGYQVDISTGQKLSKAVVPNLQEAILRRMPSYNRSMSVTEDEKDIIERRKGVKFKGQTYDRVLPMKASVKLPVIIFGPKFVVNALISLISTETPASFLADTSDYTNTSDADFSDLYRQDVHIVRRARIDMLSQKSVQRIILFVNVSAVISPLVYRDMFGEEFEMEISADIIDQCSKLKQKLEENGQNFEELNLPEQNNKKCLLKSFKSCVKSQQERVLWLSSKEMDSQVADTYSKYLGHDCDLTDIMTCIQRAQSFDQS